MPIQRCTKSGQRGWKWGESGTCYIGRNAKEKAIAQALAIGGGEFPEDNYKKDSIDSEQYILSQLRALKETGKLKIKKGKTKKWIDPPKTMINKYNKEILDISEPFRNILKKQIIPNLERWGEENKNRIQDNYIKDDWQDELDKNLDKYDKTEKEIFDEQKEGLNAKLFFFFGLVNKFNLKQFKKIFKEKLNFEYIMPESWTNTISKNWVRENVALIKGLSNEYRKKFVETIYRGMQEGRTHDFIEKELIKIDKRIYTGRTKTVIDKKTGKKRRKKVQSRSELIARDQVNKLNGRLTKKRQTEVGIETYFWITSRDERVRPKHNNLHGGLCRWDDDTVISFNNGVDWVSRAGINGYIGIPGSDYQCRCGSNPGWDSLLNKI